MRIISLIAPLLVPAFLAGTADKAYAGLFISVSVAPPPLVVYTQPPIPGPGYMWTPGYWGWEVGARDYYWVPGAWVLAPEPGLLWTPGYWGWSNGIYVWNAGYWGPHVGFYGGINYGAGYGGVGFEGGSWHGSVFAYNQAVTNVDGSGINIRVYNQTVISRGPSLVSFNGGNGGVRAQPTPQELAFASERHIPLTADQLKHQQLASKSPGLRLANNHGRPPIAATSRAADFSKGHVFGSISAGSAFKPAPLRSLGSGNLLTSRMSSGATPDRPRTGAGVNVNPPKGAALNTIRRPGLPLTPRPGQRPVGKQPPKNNGKSG